MFRLLLPFPAPLHPSPPLAELRAAHAGVILVRVRVVGEVPKKALEAWRRTGSFRLLAKQARKGGKVDRVQVVGRKDMGIGCYPNVF